MSEPSPGSVRDHYERADAVDDVLAEIAAGTDIGPALDQFHIGGAAATRRLADRLSLAPGANVLDVGSGLGGPARLLVRERGWDVTGVDLSPGFCRIAAALSCAKDLSGATRFCAADALRLPFADGAFDAVWTEHVAMNIAARDPLYAELARVVRPGGVLALFDVVEGVNTAAADYPVPWARRAAESHLVDAGMLRQTVLAAGWDEVTWTDESEFARDWLDNARPPGKPAGPSLRNVMGDDFPAMISNLRANFADGRLGAVQAVMVRTP